MNKLKELKKKAQLLDVTLRIGKNGITDTLIQEIIRQIKNKRIIKIKMLKNYDKRVDKKLWEDVAVKTNSIVVQQIGFVVVLSKK